MKEELTEHGFSELLTAGEVDNQLSKEGTTLVMINSVCGCSAGALVTGPKFPRPPERGGSPRADGAASAGFANARRANAELQPAIGATQPERHQEPRRRHRRSAEGRHGLRHHRSPSAIRDGW